MGRHLIIVPLEEEMEYLHDFLRNNGGKFDLDYSRGNKSYYFEWPLQYGRADVVCYLIGDMGNLRTSAALIQVLSERSYDYILLVGLAGSPNKMVSTVGDVVISNIVKSYYPDKVARRSDDKKEVFSAVTEFSTHAEAEYFPIDTRKKVLNDSYFRFRRDAVNWQPSQASIFEYHRAAENARGTVKTQEALEPIRQSDFEKLPPWAENHAPKIVFGAVFSSEMVIDSDEYLDFINDRDGDEQFDIYYRKRGGNHDRRRWLKAPYAAIDMESYGFFMTAEGLKSSDLNGAKCITVRGISDLASEKGKLEEDTEDGLRRIAVRNASKVALDMINYFEQYFKGRNR